MQRSSHGSRLLAFQRAHGITDPRSTSPQSPASPARHVVHGARPRRPRRPRHDAFWGLPLLVVTGLLFLVAYILVADPSDLPAPASAPPAAEVSR